MWLSDLFASANLPAPENPVSKIYSEALGSAIEKVASIYRVYSVPKMTYSRFHYLKRGTKPFQKADLTKLAKAHNLTPELYWQALARQLKNTLGDR